MPSLKKYPVLVNNSDREVYVRRMYLDLTTNTLWDKRRNHRFRVLHPPKRIGVGMRKGMGYEVSTDTVTTIDEVPLTKEEVMGLVQRTRAFLKARTVSEGLAAATAPGTTQSEPTPLVLHGSTTSTPHERKTVEITTSQGQKIVQEVTPGFVAVALSVAAMEKAEDAKSGKWNRFTTLGAGAFLGAIAIILVQLLAGKVA